LKQNVYVQLDCSKKRFSLFDVEVVISVESTRQSISTLSFPIHHDLRACHNFFQLLLFFQLHMSMTSRTSHKRKYKEVSEEDQKAIVSEYQPNVRGKGIRALAKRFRRHPATIEAVLKRAKSNNGNPVTSRGHRKRNLNEQEEQLITAKLDDNPYLTNHQLASLVDGKICDQTVSDIIHRCDPPFTEKVPFERHPETTTEEWQDDVDKFIRSTLSRIPWHRRVYEDETGISLNEAPKKGRARKGFRITRPRQPHAKKLTLHVYASETAVLFGNCPR
jgi:transposase